jgi:NTE family protein
MRPTATDRPPPEVAFVLGGGGVLGASEVGMLQALLEGGVVPDLVVGTSVGAINGAVLADAPSGDTVSRLADLWLGLSGDTVFGGASLSRLRGVARTALHSGDSLRELLAGHLSAARFEDLAVPFECCAASIQRAAEHWFASGPLVDAVLASCAVPGLFPAVEIDGEHYLDGGLVNSVPVGRAVELGARTVYVLHVGRLERPLEPPRRPWDVATVAFEIARRHRFARDMAAVPPDVQVHLLPSGAPDAPWANLRYRSVSGIARRIEAAREATAAYLAAGAVGPPAVEGRAVEGPDVGTAT